MGYEVKARLERDTDHIAIRLRGQEVAAAVLSQVHPGVFTERAGDGFTSPYVNPYLDLFQTKTVCHWSFLWSPMQSSGTLKLEFDSICYSF
jgi:hypothetical protein